MYLWSAASTAFQHGNLWNMPAQTDKTSAYSIVKSHKNPVRVVWRGDDSAIFEDHLRAASIV
jgi:hypothetical protein